MNTKEIRRQNLRMLVRLVGGVTNLANRISRSQSQISHLTSAHPCKNIGDKLATLIEQTFNKAPGWFDKEHIHDVEFNDELDPQIPLLSWTEINESIDLNKAHLFVLAKRNYSKHAFALQIEYNDMQCAQGISFSQGSTIIVDPEYLYKNGSFVIASIHGQERAVFRQLNIVDNKYILKALNNKYRSIEIPLEFVKIHGVVRCGFVEF